MADRISRYCEIANAMPPPLDRIPQCVLEKMEGGPSSREVGSAFMSLKADCDMISEKLKVIRPLIIDYFLAWNSELSEIGKLLIAAAILESEFAFQKIGGNRNRFKHMDDRHLNISANEEFKALCSKQDYRPTDDWIRFLIHGLSYGCRSKDDLYSNNVRFVTFNYDTSLEENLYRCVSAISLFGEDGACKFLSPGRVLHVYGKIITDLKVDIRAFSHDDTRMFSVAHINAISDRFRSRSWGPEQECMLSKQFESFSAFLNIAREASRSIVTIGGDGKNSNQEEISSAMQSVRNAEVLYILGYGFDVENSKRIGLFSESFRPRKKVMFTNFGDINSVNRSVADIFMLDINAFRNGVFFACTQISQTVNVIEKSSRDVYEALQLDFGVPGSKN